MKICWDNLEDLWLTRNGNFRNSRTRNTYFYKEACKYCGESFLGRKDAEYCDIVCTNKDRFFTEEHKKNISESLKGRYCGKENPFFGKTHTEKTKKIIKFKNSGKHPSNVTIERIKNKLKGRKVEASVIEKIKKTKRERYGTYYSENIPTYDTYAPQLEWCEEVRRNEEDRNILEVKCFKCGEWYTPTLNNVKNRINILKSTKGYLGEGNFYCYDECKNSCSIYRKSAETLMREDAIRAGRLGWIKLNREVQPELRKLVLEKDGYQCIKCGSKGPSLHCHHIYPVSTNPLESADIDNCLTLCMDCHKEVHQQDGCRYGQLKILEIC